MSKSDGKSDKGSKGSDRPRGGSAPASVPRSMVLAQAAIARASRTSREALERIDAFRALRARQRPKGEGDAQPGAQADVQPVKDDDPGPSA